MTAAVCVLAITSCKKQGADNTGNGTGTGSGNNDEPAVAITITTTPLGKPDITKSIEGTLILNSGNFGSNDASILIRDNKGNVTENAFFAANGQKLGDTAQDMIWTGSSIYIAMYGSKTIFVTDTNLNLVSRIDASMEDGTKLSPRSMYYENNKMYITYYEGFLAEYTPQDGSSRYVKVGPNPEGMACYEGRMYVANSGGMLYDSGYNNTVSVVRLDSMEVESTITVGCNPQSMVISSDGARMYVLSWGNYAEIPAKLEVYDMASGKLSDTGLQDVKTISKGDRYGDSMYIVTGGYDQNWQVEGTLWEFDTAANKLKGKFYEGAFSPYYSMNFCEAPIYVYIEDPYIEGLDSPGNEHEAPKDQIFIGLSDYMTEGGAVMLDAKTGSLENFKTAGLNPIKALIL